ncbi:MAG: hypothetical protein PHX43_05235 [Alphaproteobacteria bacterium]|nr:hypothetical protein [Alphaproteobacteria bacterium]
MYYTKLRLASQDLVGLLHDREDLMSSCRSMPLGAQLWAMTTVDRIEQEIATTVSRISKLKKEEQKEEKKEDSEFIESRVFVSEDGIRIRVKKGDMWHTKWHITPDGDVRNYDA